ncbi:MAG: hypothetical protein WCG20_00905 [bacterium]
MKKSLLLAIVTIVSVATYAQTFYSGKYRNLFYDLPAMDCSKHLCRATAAVDSFKYVIQGFRDGDDFLVMKLCNKKLIVMQSFYMNGEKKLDDATVGDLFKDDFTLDYFLETVFNYSIPKRKK